MEGNQFGWGIGEGMGENAWFGLDWDLGPRKDRDYSKPARRRNRKSQEGYATAGIGENVMFRAIVSRLTLKREKKENVPTVP